MAHTQRGAPPEGSLLAETVGCTAELPLLPGRTETLSRGMDPGSSARPPATCFWPRQWSPNADARSKRSTAT